MIFFIFLNLLVSTFLIIPNWNLKNASVNLLSSSDTKKYVVSHRTMYGLFAKLEKTITKLSNGTIIHQNTLTLNDTPTTTTVSYENIESLYKKDGKKILCPKGKYDPVNLETNSEIKNYNKDEDGDFELKCYLHNEGYFFVYYFRNGENQTYNLLMSDLNYEQYSTLQFGEELYDFKLVNKEGNKNYDPYQICTLAKRDNYIQFISADYNLKGGYSKANEKNKTLIKSKAYSQGYFNNFTNNFYYITYDNISDFTSGYSTKTVSGNEYNPSDIDNTIKISNNYNTPFEFLNEVEIKEMNFLLYTNYVYYSIYNKITQKTYHGVFNVLTNKIIFNTDEDIDVFIPYSNY